MADQPILQWPVRTAEYMHFTVTADVDPLLDDVFVALVAHRTPPQDGDYKPAEWVPGQVWVNAGTLLQVRRFLPKDTLTRGDKYDAWVRPVDNPETPEMFAGVVKGV